MTIEYFVVYEAKAKDGTQVTGRTAATTTARITCIEDIAYIEKMISETVGVTQVIITNWRRFEPVD